MNNLTKSILALISILLAITTVASNKFSYALDYELQVLTKDCTYDMYIKDKQLCIKGEYK